MIHLQRGLVAGRTPHHFCRHAGDSGVSGHIFQHDTAGAHLGTLPHPDIAQDFGACTDQHAVAYFRVAIAFVLASAAQGDRLQNGDIVADHGGLADDQPGGVV